MCPPGSHDLSAWFGPIERDGQSISRYLGHYTYGRRVIMHYEIGDTRFLENISNEKWLFCTHGFRIGEGSRCISF